MDNVIFLRESWPDAKLCGYSIPGWYFWAESQHCHGPFESEEQARRVYLKYVKILNKENKMEKERPKIPIHEFEEEVTIILATLVEDILDPCETHLYKTRLIAENVASISEAAVRILFNGDK